MPSSTAPSTAASTSLTIEIAGRHQISRLSAGAGDEVAGRRGTDLERQPARPADARQAIQQATSSRWAKHTDSLDDVLTIAIFGLY